MDVIGLFEEVSAIYFHIHKIQELQRQFGSDQVDFNVKIESIDKTYYFQKFGTHQLGMR